MSQSQIIVWRRQQRRAAILKSARKLLLRDGYQNTSMEAVALDACVSKTTVYKNYASKNELFVAVCEDESRRTLGAVFETIDLDGDIHTSLEIIARRIMTVLVSNDLVAFHRLVVAETANFPGIGVVAYEYGIRRCAERMAAIFEEAAARGDLNSNDTAALAGQFLALCLGRSYWQRLFGVADSIDKSEIDEDAARTVATFLAAFGKACG